MILLYPPHPSAHFDLARSVFESVQWGNEHEKEEDYKGLEGTYAQHSIKVILICKNKNKGINNLILHYNFSLMPKDTLEIQMLSYYLEFR